MFRGSDLVAAAAARRGTMVMKANWRPRRGPGPEGSADPRAAGAPVELLRPRRYPLPLLLMMKCEEDTFSRVLPQLQSPVGRGCRIRICSRIRT